MADHRLSALRRLAEAALARGEARGRLAEQLVEGFDAWDEDDRYECVDALEGARDAWVAHQRSPEVLGFLLEQAQRPESRRSGGVLGDLALALGGYDDDRAIDALAEIVLDRGANVMARNAAADRLFERNRPRLKPVWEAVEGESNAAGISARQALRDLAGLEAQGK